MQRVRHEGLHPYTLFRPLIHWTAANVFALAKVHGVPPNPLYRQGMGRVGCFPCINASKPELRQIGMRFPEAVDLITEWEAIVRGASKHQAATFFAPTVTPAGAALGQRIKREASAKVARDRPDLDGPERDRAIKAAGSELSIGAPWPRAAEVFDWAKTGRGGRNFDIINWLEESDDDGLSCSSQYGLCE